MTTIVAVQGEHDVLLGWDGQVTRSNEAYHDLTPKVFIRNGIIYACAGITRMADIIMYADFPEYDGTDARRWLVTQWIPAFRDAIAGDPALFDSEDGALQESALMVILDGTIFHFDSLLSPTTIQEGIYGMGSGSDYAKGALYAGADLMTALTVAASIDPYTGGTLTVTTAAAMILSEAF